MDPRDYKFDVPTKDRLAQYTPNNFIPPRSRMLVLTRKAGERIWIGDDISVTVVRVTGGGVRLGIEAPHELPVVREELKQRLLEQISEADGSAQLSDDNASLSNSEEKSSDIR